jgi:hypothetical protein
MPVVLVGTTMQVSSNAGATPPPPRHFSSSQTLGARLLACRDTADVLISWLAPQSPA